MTAAHPELRAMATYIHLSVMYTSHFVIDDMKGYSTRTQKGFMRATPFQLTPPTTPPKLPPRLHSSSSWLTTLNRISDRVISTAS